MYVQFFPPTMRYYVLDYNNIVYTRKKYKKYKCSKTGIISKYQIDVQKQFINEQY